LFPNTATEEYLEYRGEPFNITRKQPSTAAGSADFTGTNGTNISSGTKLINDDGGQYSTIAPGVISGGTANIAIQADAPGADYNMEHLAILTLVNPISGIDDQAFVDTNGITGGSDLETDDSLRERILTRQGIPAMGGSNDDYITWARETSGLNITRIWVFPEYMGPMSVYIFFVLDDQDPIFPNTSEIAAVQSQIDGKAPNIARVTVASPVERKIGLVCSVLPNTAEVRDSVKDSLLNFFRNNVNVGEVIYKAALDEAVSLAAGELSHEIQAITLDGQAIVPVGDVYLGNGDLSILEFLIINGITVYTIY
jgi:uncharacterized phage protein gp47/JayE